MAAIEPQYLPLVQGLAITSIFAVILYLFEIGLLLVVDARRNKSWRGGFNRLNGAIIIGLLGITGMHLVRIESAFAGEYTAVHETFTAGFVGTAIFCYMAFLYERSSAILESYRIGNYIQFFFGLVFILMVLTTISTGFQWQIGSFYVYYLFYFTNGICIMSFDSLFTVILFRQLRQLEQMLNVKDEEMVFVARIGLYMIAVSILVTILFCFASFLPTSMYAATMCLTVLTNHVNAFIAHIYVYAKIVRPALNHTRTHSSRSKHTTSGRLSTVSRTSHV